MRILLDTNALLWLLGGDPRLGAQARAAVESAAALVVSEASLWEESIKVSIGKLQPIPGFHQAIGDLGFERLGIADAHLARLESLPHRHKDPFDRMLIAQALAENLVIMTADRAFSAYGVQVLDAAV